MYFQSEIIQFSFSNVKHSYSSMKVMIHAVFMNNYIFYLCMVGEFPNTGHFQVCYQ